MLSSLVLGTSSVAPLELFTLVVPKPAEHGIKSRVDSVVDKEVDKIKRLIEGHIGRINTNNNIQDIESNKENYSLTA